MSTRIAQMGRSPSISHQIDEAFSSTIGRVEAGLIVVVDAVLDFLDDQRERATLMRLDDRQLKDIGLTRTDIGYSGDERGPAA